MIFDGSENIERDDSTTDAGSQTMALEAVSVQEKALRSLLHFLKMAVESREKCTGTSRGDFGTDNQGGDSNHERESWEPSERKTNRESSSAASQGAVENSQCVFCRYSRHRNEDCESPT